MSDLSMVYFGTGFEGSPTGIPFSNDLYAYDVNKDKFDVVKSCYGDPRLSPIFGSINNSLYLADGMRYREDDVGGIPKIMPPEVTVISIVATTTLFLDGFVLPEKIKLLSSYDWSKHTGGYSVCTRVFDVVSKGEDPDSAYSYMYYTDWYNDNGEVISTFDIGPFYNMDVQCMYFNCWAGFTLGGTGGTVLNIGEDLSWSEAVAYQGSPFQTFYYLGGQRIAEFPYNNPGCSVALPYP